MITKNESQYNNSNGLIVAYLGFFFFSFLTKSHMSLVGPHLFLQIVISGNIIIKCIQRLLPLVDMKFDGCFSLQY